MNFSPRINRTAAGISVLALAFIAIALPARAQSQTGAPPAACRQHFLPEDRPRSGDR